PLPPLPAFPFMGPLVAEPAEPCSVATVLDSYASSEQPTSAGGRVAAAMKSPERRPHMRDRECFIASRLSRGGAASLAPAAGAFFLARGARPPLACAACRRSTRVRRSTVQHGAWAGAQDRHRLAEGHAV